MASCSTPLSVVKILSVLFFLLMIPKAFRTSQLMPMNIMDTIYRNVQLWSETLGASLPLGMLLFWFLAIHRSLLHDPEVYNDPGEYIPDRFLKDGQPDDSIRDPSIAAFGYGRRICPGRYFGLDSLFLIIAHTLAVFDIKPALDEHGNEIQAKADFTSGLSSYVW